LEVVRPTSIIDHVDPLSLIYEALVLHNPQVHIVGEHDQPCNQSKNTDGEYCRKTFGATRCEIVLKLIQND
jgi:hypothetical protein